MILLKKHKSTITVPVRVMQLIKDRRGAFVLSKTTCFGNSKIFWDEIFMKFTLNVHNTNLHKFVKNNLRIYVKNVIRSFEYKYNQIQSNFKYFQFFS